MKLWRLFKRLGPEILSRPMFQPLNRSLFNIAASGLGVGNYNLSRRDERRLLLKLRKTLPSDAIMLDVGANSGQYATLARAVFPDARIYSFEPNPAAFAKLVETARQLRIQPIALGCGSAPGTRLMFDRAADAGTPFATLVPGVIEQRVATPARFDVELTTIDIFCQEQGLAEVHLLKIDVEGFEQNVLEGAAAMLAKRAVRVVQFEFNEMNLLSHTTMDDMAALLDGYALHRLLYDGSLLPIGAAHPMQRNLFGFQNIVAVREDAPLR